VERGEVSQSEMRDRVCASAISRERARTRRREDNRATRNAHQRRYKRIYQKAKNGAEAGRYPRDIYSADTKNLRANFDLLAARSLTIAMTMTIARERERERERERAWRVSTRKTCLLRRARTQKNHREMKKRGLEMHFLSTLPWRSLMRRPRLLPLRRCRCPPPLPLVLL
jgi:hypothetical protein